MQGEIQGFLYRLEVLSSLDSVFVSSEETRAEFSPSKISILFQCNWGLKNGEHCLSLRSLVSRFVARSLVSLRGSVSGLSLLNGEHRPSLRGSVSVLSLRGLVSGLSLRGSVPGLSLRGSVPVSR